MLLEYLVGKNAGTERQRHDQQQSGAAANQHAPPRQHEFADDSDEGRRDQERDQGARDVARIKRPSLTTHLERARGRIEEQRGNVEVELRIDAECDTDHGGNG